MSRIFLVLLLCFVLSSVTFLSGCDVSAERELKRAEKALEAAMEVSADAHATEDYNSAEEYFQEAVELSNDNRVQEARAAAIKAKLKAEDARNKAEERMRILESEMDRLGR
ncbi:MAG: DUF4398 domain-containing protein [Calditrichaeota bacterium]|jgi:hypothetical protein|nr:DUF4398 domain-containing protein [Calditrichota bacterium]MBT7618409.1 DUF4398 domain-containing protein [Calditrichota bacterium]MBT7790201.1 DUF4398 domain-containing protein [Calditrichota bacterium]